MLCIVTTTVGESTGLYPARSPMSVPRFRRSALFFYLFIFPHPERCPSWNRLRHPQPHHVFTDASLARFRQMLSLAHLALQEVGVILGPCRAGSRFLESGGYRHTGGRGGSLPTDLYKELLSAAGKAAVYRTVPRRCKIGERGEG